MGVDGDTAIEGGVGGVRYTYSCKTFSIHGASLESFRAALESFGLSEKEIGEKIMDCERRTKDPKSSKDGVQ